MSDRQDGTSRSPYGEEMHRRRITLADGRYMIFYTFSSPPHPPSEPKPGAHPNPESEEERRV